MPDPTVDRDAERLAELGYKQELDRGWTRFTNFAISFSIISVLAGCFTLFYVGVEQRRADRDLDRLAGDRRDHPHGRSQHVRARLGLPHRGRSVLVGPSARRGRMVVVHRLVQRARLIGIVASVDYVLAFFRPTCSASGAGIWASSTSPTSSTSSRRSSGCSRSSSALHALINIFSHRLIALFNSISVWWHVIGVLIIIGILIIVPDSHQSADFVFTERINNSGFADGADQRRHCTGSWSCPSASC